MSGVFSTVSFSTEASANWKAGHHEKWTVPLQLNVSKLIAFGPFPASVGIGGAYFASQPTGGPNWRLRMSFTLLLPQKN